MKKVFIIVGLIVFLLVVGIVVYYFFFRKNQPVAGGPAPIAPGTGPITNVAGTNTVAGQQAAIENATNANKTVKAKNNYTKPYNFVCGTGDFPIYEKSIAPLEIYNAGATLGTFAEAFQAYDLNKLMDVAATEGVAKLNGHITQCGPINYSALNYFQDKATAMQFFQNRRSIYNFQQMVKGGFDASAFNVPSWGNPVCLGAANNSIPAGVQRIGNNIIYFDQVQAQKTFYKVTFNSTDYFFNSEDVNLI